MWLWTPGLPVVPEVKMKRKLDMSLAGVISMGGRASPDAFSTLSSNVSKPSTDEVLSVTHRLIPLSFRQESTSSRELTKSEDTGHNAFYQNANTYCMFCLSNSLIKWHFLTAWGHCTVEKSKQGSVVRKSSACAVGLDYLEYSNQFNRHCTKRRTFLHTGFSVY